MSSSDWLVRLPALATHQLFLREKKAREREIQKSHKVLTIVATSSAAMEGHNGASVLQFNESFWVQTSFAHR